MNKIYSTFNGTEIDRQSILLDLPEPWQMIVDKLFDDMFAAGWDGHLTQVKEKFGALRVYVSESSDEVQDLIDRAEAKTAKICIQCGNPATATTKGWYTHVCDEHKR